MKRLADYYVSKALLMDHTKMWSAQSVARAGELEREAERKERQQTDEERRYRERDLQISNESNQYAKESNDIAREASRDAKEANDIAREANRNSRETNKIAWIAIVISVVSPIVTYFMTRK